MDGLAHIGLVVKNTEQTVAFYTQQLGFQKVAEKTIQTENGKLQVTFLRNGNLTLECLEHEVFPQAHGDGLIVHIAINVKNIEKVIEALDAYGVEWVEGPRLPAGSLGKRLQVCTVQRSKRRDPGSQRDALTGGIYEDRYLLYGFPAHKR